MTESDDSFAVKERAKLHIQGKERTGPQAK